MADPLVFIRGVHFAATLVACGTVGFVRLVAEPTKPPSDFRLLRDRLTILTWLALAVVVLSGAAWMALLAADIVGAPLVDVCLHGRAWPVLFETRFGPVWCARLGLAIALALLLLRPGLRVSQLAAAALLLALPAVVGHAGATPGLAGDVHLLSDTLHLLAAGAWLGGLPAFVWLLWQARREAKPTWGTFAIRATRRFSIVSTLSVLRTWAEEAFNQQFHRIEAILFRARISRGIVFALHQFPFLVEIIDLLAPIVTEILNPPEIGGLHHRIHVLHDPGFIRHIDRLTKRGQTGRHERKQRDECEGDNPDGHRHFDKAKAGRTRPEGRRRGGRFVHTT